MPTLNFRCSDEVHARLKTLAGSMSLATFVRLVMTRVAEKGETAVAYLSPVKVGPSITMDEVAEQFAAAEARGATVGMSANLYPAQQPQTQTTVETLQDRQRVDQWLATHPRPKQVGSHPSGPVIEPTGLQVAGEATAFNPKKAWKQP